MRGVKVSLEQVQVWGTIVTIGLSPWAVGCVVASFELYLAQALVIVVAVWCARLVWEPGLLEKSVRRAGRAGIALACLVGSVAVPLLPLSESVTAAISPGVSEWITQAQPSQREVLATSDVVIRPPASRLTSGGLSLNPFGNAQLAWRLGALFMLFVACVSVRQAEAALRQLCWAAACFGSLLALVAMLQSVSPDSDQLYWFFQTKGTTYGPFLNRNHYPFFANLAIGLTLGLLLERWASHGRVWTSFVRDTPLLWLSMSLGLQLCSLAMCLSRGGIASLIVALSLCVWLRRGQGVSTVAATSGLLVVAIVVGLMAWTGFDLLESRLSTLSEAETYREDGRWYLWKAALLVIPHFVWWGSGGETFRHWETIIQFPGPWSSATLFAHRADNEYLDIWCEHGVLAVLSLLSFVASILVTSGRRVPTHGLIAGAWVALLAVALHSFVDFGLRIPASGVFAMAVAGLSYAASRPPSSTGVNVAVRKGQSQVTEDRRIEPASSPLIEMFSLPLVVVAILGLLVAFVREKHRFAQAHQHRWQAYSAVAQEDAAQTRLNLRAMLAATPDDGVAHIEAARLELLMARRSPSTEERRQWVESAITHCVQARDLCPLAWEPQLWIAEHVRFLQGNVQSMEYLQRGHKLHPSNATIAYLLGNELQQAGADRDQVYVAWQAALGRSSKYLKPILTQCFDAREASQAMPEFAEELLQQVLPTNSRILLEAAGIVAEFGAAEAQQLFLEAAAKQIALDLPHLPAKEQAAGYGLSAEIEVQLGDPTTAVELLRKAIPLAPDQLSWRFRLIELLIEAGDAAAASKELRLVELLQPDSSRISHLRERIKGLATRG